MIPGLYVVKEDNKVILQIPNSGQTAVSLAGHHSYLFVKLGLHNQNARAISNGAKVGCF